MTRLLLIAIPWSVTAPTLMLLLATMFRHGMKSKKNEKSFGQYEKNQTNIKMIV
ncbi:MAG: hypothetical protein M3139_08785 [Bacteroidota bacterium]|nr:hypothetical protein [Bacteroidota bacterium]